MNPPKGLLDSINIFEDLIKQAPDTRASVPDFLKFIRYFLRTKDPKHSLPTIEVMSLLKHHKPNVFGYVRKQASLDANLKLITQLQMDVHRAEQRLQELKTKLH
ncbi:hypothetical protein [Alkalihalobacterium chitinilyticum]|uniref:Uncharacterized protein n=1 Tax=Alkalihalobacterium chitinilyticum TaxID=2980103 RepID=A0ABT5VAN6_9BACI|nr:hypothetical protein [Alkalihalobacterium chitinilyticum]MDE5412505.1 hypothetical protein [Alkalihalobacterium chitinilyticum]